MPPVAVVVPMVGSNDDPRQLFDAAVDQSLAGAPRAFRVDEARRL